jgi:RNA polymerase-binding transcription factor DksA
VKDSFARDMAEDANTRTANANDRINSIMDRLKKVEAILFPKCPHCGQDIPRKQNDPTSQLR